jgi:cell division protein FtsB
MSWTIEDAIARLNYNSAQETQQQLIAAVDQLERTVAELRQDVHDCNDKMISVLEKLIDKITETRP